MRKKKKLRSLHIKIFPYLIFYPCVLVRQTQVLMYIGKKNGCNIWNQTPGKYKQGHFKELFETLFMNDLSGQIWRRRGCTKLIYWS